MATQKRVLVAASMNGGAEAVAPVVHRLRGQGHNVFVLSYSAATSTFREHKIEPDVTLATREALAPAVCGSIVRSFQPRSILMGTQVQDRGHPLTLENMVLDTGRLLGVPTVAVLDTWTTYLERFSDLDLTVEPPHSIRLRLSQLPSAIAVPNDFARLQMVNLGFPSDILAVTGNPYFEHARTEFARLSPTTRANLLAKPVFSSFDLDGKLVVFMSDAMEQSYPDLGFTEKSVLQSFLQVLDRIAEETTERINVIVRPHPFRNAGAADAFACDTPHIWKVLHHPATARGANPENDYSMEELLHAAHVVAGTFNNPLITAAVVDRPVLSYVLGMNPKYTFYDFLVEQGVWAQARSEAELDPLLSAMLAGTYSQASLGVESHGATDRVIALLQ